MGSFFLGIAGVSLTAALALILMILFETYRDGKK